MIKIFLIFGLTLFILKFGSGGSLQLEQQQQQLSNITKNNNITLPLNQSSLATPTSQRTHPPRVKLNKCCKFGEYLDSPSLSCVAGSTDLWIPKIFLTVKKEFYKQNGRAPNFMSFRENVRPVKGMTTSDSDDGCTSEELELFTGSANIVLFSNGSLFLPEHSRIISAEMYCVDREAALICRPKQMQRELKIHKCCGKFSSYDSQAQTCTKADTNKISKLKLKTIDESDYQPLYGFPKCTGSSTTYAIAGDWSDAHLNTATGILVLDRKNFTSSDYCLEHLRDGNGTSAKVKVFACLHHYKEMGPEVPANATNATKASMGDSAGAEDFQTVILNFGIVVSVVFLAATLVASYLMPSVHHVLHWRCQIYYVFCLFVGESMLAYTQLGVDLKSWGSVPCLTLASLMHFFFLSAFFWLNTMCFNIWWTFRDFRPSSLERNQELLRLRLYSAYAWGIPIIICSLAVLMDHLPYDDLLRPNFGVRNCWFSGEDLSIFAYFYGPMGLLLCANIILFISTTHQLTCGLWKRDDVKSTTEKTALGKVCLKLVVVMGVTWIADILSWVVGGPHSVWFFTDLINALQGVFIFIVVGCQPQVWAACKRFCCPRLRQEITNTTNGVQHSSSSQGLPSLAACGPELTQNTSINTTVGCGAALHGVVEAVRKVPMETEC